MWVSPKSASAKLEASAAELCAVIFDRTSAGGRFAMEAEDAREALSLTAPEFAMVLTGAAAQHWVRCSSTSIELTATGIYVAKVILDLPR